MAKILNFEKFISLNEAQAPMKNILKTKGGKDVFVVRAGKDDEYQPETNKVYVEMNPDTSGITISNSTSSGAISSVTFTTPKTIQKQQGVFLGDKLDVPANQIKQDAYGILYRIAFYALNDSKTPGADQFKEALQIINKIDGVKDFKKIATGNKNYNDLVVSLKQNATDPSKAILFGPAKTPESIKAITDALSAVPLA